MLAERRKLQEAKEKEKQMSLNMLLMQQEHNLEKAFLVKKELEKINKDKESILEKKKAMYNSTLPQFIPKGCTR